MSTLKVATIQDLSSANSSTPEQVAQGRAKAWVNFNTVTSTTITDSYNVSSLTDNGTGDTTVNFTVAMPSANYVVSAMTLIDTASAGSSSWLVGVRATSGTPTTKTTSACRFTATSLSPTNVTDSPNVGLVFFGD